MGGSRYLNLVLPDNSLVSYELANGVDIQFQDSIIVVNDLSFYMENIVKYYFSRGHASTYNITVAANPIDGGSVSQSGDGNYTYGDTCTLTATANQGYNFVNWTKNDTAVSVSPTYTFTVTESASFVANFIQDQGEITQVANFSVVTNYLYKGREGAVAETFWFNVNAWAGRNMPQDFTQIEKGSSVLVQGRLRNREYQSSDGQARIITEVVASCVKLCKDEDKPFFTEE